MFCKLVECSDYRTEYGILHFTNTDITTLSDTISEIKNRFYEEGFDDWNIGDVLDELPSEWNVYLESMGMIDVVEI